MSNLRLLGSLVKNIMQFSTATGTVILIMNLVNISHAKVNCLNRQFVSSFLTVFRIFGSYEAVDSSRSTSSYPKLLTSMAGRVASSFQNCLIHG